MNLASSFIYIIIFCHIEIKYMHNLIQVDELREPMEANKAYEKDHLENIYILNYEKQYWD